MFKQLVLPLLVSSSFLSGCYLERDINYVRPEQPLVKKRTVSQIIYYKSKHRIRLTRSEFSELKAKIEQAQKIQDIQVNIIGQSLKNVQKSKRINELKRLLNKLGVADSAIQVMNNIKEDQNSVQWEPDMMVIEIEWYDRQAVPCPGWDHVMNGRVAPEGEGNFGCTNKSNLAQMVVNPKDLLAGQALESSDGQYTNMSIDRYHKDKMKVIKIEKIKESN